MCNYSILLFYLINSLLPRNKYKKLTRRVECFPLQLYMAFSIRNQFAYCVFTCVVHDRFCLCEENFF